MKKHLTIVCALMIALTPLSSLQAAPAQETTSYLIRFTQEVTEPTGTLQVFGAEHIEANDRLNLYEAELTPEMARRLAEGGKTTLLEPNAPVAIAAGFIPNDPLRPAQTYLETSNFYLAWLKTIGSPAVTVAVIDTGVNYFHEDLQGKFWSSPQKQFGYDFVNKDGDPYDDHGHGTAVAGIIAANINNGTGISGASNSTIMALKAMDADGLGEASKVAEAIRYAADNGAKIINMSITLSQPSVVLDQAISYATNKGSLIVAATGNHCQTTQTTEQVETKAEECVDIISYIALNPEVVTVTALGEDGLVGSFAHTGDAVDITAPGGRIYATAWVPDNIFNAYGSYRGTSFAAPQVSAAAALALAQDSSLTPAQLKKRLLGSAVKLPAMNGAAFTPQYGYGRLDAEKVLSYDKTPPLISASLFVAQNGSYRIGGTIQDDTLDSPAGNAPTSNIKLVQYHIDGGTYQILNQAATQTLTLDATTLPLAAGEHTIVIEATDSSGNIATKTLKTSEAIVGNVSTNINEYHGAVVAQSPYLSIAAGQKKTMSIAFKNTGQSVWLRDKVRLGTTNKQDRASIFADSSWLSNNRIGMKEGVVAPGQVAHFEFTITGPAQLGSYKEYFALVADGVGWFANVGAFWIINSETPSYHAEFVNQSPYIIVNRGDSAQAWVEFKNTGSLTWDAGNISLGTSEPLDRESPFYNSATNSGWKGPNRIKMSKQQVAPGETVRFTFTIKAPDIPNIYREYFRPVADGVGWMEDYGLYWVIAVQ